MGKALVLAEKPSVGKELAKVLKCNENKGAYIEGNKYIVTWAMGHLWIQKVMMKNIKSGAWKHFQCYQII